MACARRCYSGTQQWVGIMARTASGASLLVMSAARLAEVPQAPRPVDARAHRIRRARANSEQPRHEAGDTYPLRPWVGLGVGKI